MSTNKGISFPELLESDIPPPEENDRPILTHPISIPSARPDNQHEIVSLLREIVSISESSNEILKDIQKRIKKASK